MAQVIIAFGSNIGDRIATCQRAIIEVAHLGKVEKISSLYESAPMYLENQSAFINGVFQLETNLAPNTLLQQLKAIEKQLGRQDGVRNGPRIIDLDIIWHEDFPIHDSDPILPHPGACERRFVLEPLNEIAPGLVLNMYDSVQKLLESEYIQNQVVWRITGEAIQLPSDQ